MKSCFLISKRLGLSLLKEIPDFLPGSLVLHPDDRDDERSVLREVRETSITNGADFHVVASRTEADSLIRSYGPEIVLVCGWYWLLDQAILSLPRLGAYGIHNSLLPKYRGGAPLVWSILQGEPVVGSSMFRLANGVDNGPIVCQVRVENTLDKNIGDILNEIEQAYCSSFRDIWKSLLQGNHPLRQQDEKEATYCAQRIPDDGKIDWNWSALRVHNFIRAQSSPYPGAFTHFKGSKIVFEKTRLSDRIILSTPGQVLERNRNGSVLVACGGNTSLWIDEIRGGKAPAEVIKSIRVRFS